MLGGMLSAHCSNDAYLIAKKNEKNCRNEVTLLEAALRPQALA